MFHCLASLGRLKAPSASQRGAAVRVARCVFSTSTSLRFASVDDSNSPRVLLHHLHIEPRFRSFQIKIFFYCTFFLSKEPISTEHDNSNFIHIPVKEFKSRTEQLAMTQTGAGRHEVSRQEAASTSCACLSVCVCVCVVNLALSFQLSDAENPLADKTKNTNSRTAGIGFKDSPLT